MKGTLTLKPDGRIGINEPSPPKVPRRTRIKALLCVFAERWPLAFDKTHVRPLQIGVGAEIEAALKGEVPRGWDKSRGKPPTYQRHLNDRVGPSSPYGDRQAIPRHEVDRDLVRRLAKPAFAG
jgi:hypothetical protein